MSFITVKASIISLLGRLAAGRYQVIGYKPGPKGADEITDDDKYVTVTYKKGNFDRDSNAHGKDLIHACTFQIELVAAKEALADVSTINDPTSTEAEVASATAAALRSDFLVDAELDALWDIIFKIILDPVNVDLDLDEYSVADRWLTGFEKFDLEDRGDRSIVGGVAYLTLITDESLTGDTSGVALEQQDSTIQVTHDEDVEDSVTKTEVKTEY